MSIVNFFSFNCLIMNFFHLNQFDYLNLFFRWLSKNKVNNGSEIVQIDLKVHKERKTWFFPNGSRIEADKILSSKPDGTFLIRPSTIGQYALSIM